MKMLSNRILKPASGLVILCLIIMASGCTKKFDDYNTDPTKLLDLTPTEFPRLFARAQSASTWVNWRYQYGQNWFADLYSQYFYITETYIPNDRYIYSSSDLEITWKVIYTEVVPQLRTLLEQTDPASPENALAKIWWVWTFHRNTDYFGPIPYSAAGDRGSGVPYDSQENIYNDFFTKLQESEAILKATSGKTPYGVFDRVYQGDVSKWIKFANTLRLRLALRISKVNPGKAKTEAEAALAGGVMTNIADDAWMVKTPVPGDDYGGVSSIAVWNEFRMSASMESVLKGYNDPRIGIYFQKATATNGYDGGRNGMFASEQLIDMNKADYNSNVGARWVSGSGQDWKSVAAPQNILHTAEAFFLRAEGALNGWSMGGTAEQLYNQGIAASMNQWGITDAAAITAYINSSAVPISPGDYFNSPPMNDYPIKWSSDPAMQRKQLAQQKWLALYPDGMEAWSDLRRAGVQQLYPVLHSDNSAIPQGKFIRRLPFLDLEVQTNKAEVEAGKALLGGPDAPLTPLWWDKN
ncbi:MAG: SusD/RagB family nutrient-binding outer membrane lipoprotein [Ferruginibacter sp.]